MISSDPSRDPARPTRFEKKKNMLPNVLHLQQFHVETCEDASRDIAHAWTALSHGIAGYVTAPGEPRAAAVNCANEIFPGRYVKDCLDCLTGGEQIIPIIRRWHRHHTASAHMMAQHCSRPAQ